MILATFGYAFETVRQHLAVASAMATQGSHAGEIEQHAYSSGQAAHITFTNLNGFSLETCVRGVVSAKRGSAKAYSAPVCTGEMKPHTTLVLESPYDVGAVEETCPSDDKFSRLDWSKCTFTTERVATK